MKPIALCAIAIRNSSEEGDIVFDPFMGSGSTMLAAHQLGRRCFGVELDPVYCQVVVDRMKALAPDLKVVVKKPVN